MKLFLIFLLVTLISNISAEEGYVFEEDLNDDGYTDSLKSGPIGMFGNAGGPFMLKLSRGDGSYSQKIIGLHPKAAALEKNGINSRIWYYWRSSVSEGDLGNVMLDGSFEESSIKLYFGENDSSSSNQIYKLIFDEDKLIKFRKVSDYIPPEHQWGK